MVAELTGSESALQTLLQRVLMEDPLFAGMHKTMTEILLLQNTVSLSAEVQWFTSPEINKIIKIRKELKNKVLL